MVRRHTQNMVVSFDTPGTLLTHYCVIVVLYMCVLVPSVLVRGAGLPFQSPPSAV